MILQADPSTVVTLHPRRVHPRRRWLLIVALSTAVPVLLACTFFLAYWDDAEIGNGLETEHWDGIPRFVETVLPKTSIPKNSTIRQRICITSADLWSRYGWKLAAKRSFSATPSQVCNIRDSLTECMKLTGTRYLIAHEVESVSFGHTNVLNGEEWVKAFEEALQNNRPHCWRWVAGWHHWRENLLLIRESSRLVKVVPPTRLADYQKAGLVSASYVTLGNSSQPLLSPK